MGSSTGSLLVHEEETRRAVLSHGHRRVAVHSEDEARLRERFELIRDGGKVAQHPEWRDVETAVRSTKRLLRLAREAGRRVHVLHVTTAEERSEEHTSELQSLMRITYDVFCLKQKKNKPETHTNKHRLQKK